MLAEHFAINMARELSFELFSGFSAKAKESLMDYHWPGNIRELKNVVERSVYRCNNPHVPVHELVIDPFESPFRPSKRVKTQDRVAAPVAATTEAVKAPEQAEPVASMQSKLEVNRNFPVSLKGLSQEFEIDLIQNALASCQFNQKKTADALELTYHQLRGYLKKYNLLDSNNQDDE